MKLISFIEPINKIKANPQLRRLRIPLIALAIFLVLENFVLAYNNLQSNTPVLGLKLEKQNLTFKNKSQVQATIQNQIDKLPNLKFTADGKTFTIRKEDVGLKVNKEVLLRKLLRLGRTGNFFSKLLYQNQALLGLKSEKLSGDISETKLTLLILNWQQQLNKDAQPATPDFTGNINKVIPAQDGSKVDTAKLIMLVEDNIFNAQENTITLPIQRSYAANHTESEIKKIAQDAQKLTAAPISISSGEQTFTLTAADLKSLLSVVERPDTKNPLKIVLNLRLDDVKLNQKLGEFAQKVEDVTHAEFDDHDARVAIYSQFYSGKRRNIAIPTGRNLAYRNVLGEKDQAGEKFVYLTFDDGPNSLYHPLILDILKTYGIKATFFLVGQNSQRDSDIAKRTKAEGHTIGNHSLTHSFLPNLTQTAILKEIQSAEDILKSFNGGQVVTLFRPPYGGVNNYVKRTSDKLGLKLMLWDVDPKDWSEPPEDELVRRVVSAVHNGSDILLHSNHLATVKALPKIIETLKSKGYSFKTL